MTWILTYSGGMFDAVNLDASMINVIDFAHSLSNTSRWSGHCKKAYNVADHSLRVADVIKELYPELGLIGEAAGLIHDTPEAYFRDIARPFRPLLHGYDELDAKALEMICGKYGIPYPLPPAVWEADNILLATEKRDLMNTKLHDFPTVTPHPKRIRPMSARRSKYKYLLRFHKVLNIPVNKWTKLYWNIRAII